jgi:DNA helicase II / ATP-dependent DNA helicase PcrA
VTDQTDLTPAQQTAVEHVEGPLLVLAGPGSGKTRVVTRRIAHLVHQGIPPRQVLAITFTNKAAGEMAERVEALLPGTRVWVTTFHKFCARLLRQYANAVGLSGNYTILDTADQHNALRHVMRELDFDPVSMSPAGIGHMISNAKNDLITAEMYERRFQGSIGDHWQAAVTRIYPAYQRWLLESNAVDFDDLLVHVAIMLSENDELRQSLDERYRYILVDEYQDTNKAQYQIVRALSQVHRNLCVTGDPDQSIYGWRGARIANILRFEEDFPDARVVRLEDNFRSTQAILRSAGQLIAQNTQRKDKQFVTPNAEGEAVELLVFPDSRAEADGIARSIQTAIEQQDRGPSDFAIFYRVNALSRQLELALRRHRVPYQVAAGVAFYDRAEIKDLLAYLRLIYNPQDRSAFLRAVNTPLRGLGKTSQDRLTRWAEREGVRLLEACTRAAEVPRLSKRAVTKFKAFRELIDDFSLADAGSVESLLQTIIERTAYTRGWIGSPAEQDQQKLANVEELIADARQFDNTYREQTSLEGFLEQACLVSDTDAIDDSSGRVTLMTLHAAKGLEFPVVYVVGLEEGLLPHERALRSDDRHELEEERRLLFVGMTRARQRLYLTQAQRRSIHGREMPTIPSLFATEIECDRTTFAPDEDVLPEWQRTEIDERLARHREEAADGKLSFDARPVLTTGAALLSGKGATVAIPLGFQQGQQVRHPRYGRGIVTQTDGYGARRTVTVRFDEPQQVKTFTLAQCPLQPIGT